MTHELTILRIETLAIQAVLTNGLFELKKLDPVLADAIARGLDNAANQSRTLRSRLVKQLRRSVKALGIIEDLRTAALDRRPITSNLHLG